MRYQAIFNPQGVISVGTFTGPGILDTETGRFHPRPDYSDIDVADTCRWLNNRPEYVLSHAATVRILRAEKLMPASQFLIDRSG